jgi:hypothetical protein
VKRSHASAASSTRSGRPCRGAARSRPVGLRPQELAAPVGRRRAAPTKRGGELARRVRAGDVGVGVVDGDDLASQSRSIALAARSASGSSGIQLRLRCAAMPDHAARATPSRLERALPREGAGARGRRGVPRPRGRRRASEKDRRASWSSRRCGRRTSGARPSWCG